MNDDDDGYFTDMRRIDNGHGDYIDPPLEEGWPMLTKLEWQLAMLRVDTGIRMTVQPGNHWIDGVKLLDQFSYSAMNHGWSPRGFHESWDFINGVKDGAMLAREQGVMGVKLVAVTVPIAGQKVGTRDNPKGFPSQAKRWTQPDWTGPTAPRRIPEADAETNWAVEFHRRFLARAPEVSSAIDKITAGTINASRLTVGTIADTLRYQAQNTTVLSDEPVDSYE